MLYAADPPKLTILKKWKKYKNENLQKHIILVNLVLREYQNRIQHVNKSVHAKYELCSCQGLPGAARAARSCQELPGAARGCQGAARGCQGAARGCQGLPGAARSVEL